MMQYPGSQAPLSSEIEALAQEAHALLKRDIEPSSRRTYAWLQRGYNAFCSEHNLEPFATGTAMVYITARMKAGDSGATLRSRVAAIRRLAKEAHQPDPTAHPELRQILKNAVSRIAEQRSVRRVEPATYDVLPRLVAAIDGDPAIAVRDRALVLFAFATARRGAELAQLDMADIERHEDGWIVRFKRSKTNKTGEPEYVGVPRFASDPLCPIAAMETWLEHAHIQIGPLFRTLSPVAGKGGQRIRREDISRRLDRIAAKAGLHGIWRSHSFRRGFVTSAEERGVARSRTRINTGWKSDAMFAVYADHRDVLRQSPLHEIYNRRTIPLIDPR
jgi:integrase